jgi:hypothetical protein
VLGRFLFRWRGVIGVLAFGVVFWLARPTFGSCLLGVPFLILGLAVRFWASGYIGIEGRAREIGASSRIVTGPYRVLRHPLYIGNSLLVAGMLVALRPAVWLAAVVLAGFIVEYTLIVAAEEKDLACRRIQNPESRVQNPEVRTNRQSPESTVHGPQSFLLSRALCEYRTWVGTGVAWGLAMVKALPVRS